MKYRKAILGGFFFALVLLFGARIGRAQDEPQEPADTMPKPAARSTPIPIIDSGDPQEDNGVQIPTGSGRTLLPSPACRTPPWVLRICGIATGCRDFNTLIPFSRAYNQPNSSGWFATNYLIANVSLLKAWSRSQLAVNYSGGGSSQRIVRKETATISSWVSRRLFSRIAGSFRSWISSPICRNPSSALVGVQISASRESRGLLALPCQVLAAVPSLTKASMRPPVRVSVTLERSKAPIRFHLAVLSPLRVPMRFCILCSQAMLIIILQPAAWAITISLIVRIPLVSSIASAATSFPASHKHLEIRREHSLWPKDHWTPRAAALWRTGIHHIPCAHRHAIVQAWG